MKIENKVLKIDTKKSLDFIDITDKIKSFVDDINVSDGLVNIQSMHTTAMLLLNENEPLLIEDIKKNLESIASKNKEYNHDNFDVRTVNMCDDECANGHAHCKAVYLTPTNTINLINNKLQLGKWQRVFLLELDRPRPRKVQVQVLGE
ncbi:MAG: secondary thiamine-phosphate synthase enzyme YjbQ [Patescibacteria group bacterium]